MARRAEGRDLRVAPGDVLRLLEELDVLRVRARPAALDVGHAVVVKQARDPQLVRERKGDVLALGAVAQRGVVQDDGLLARHRVAPAATLAPRRSTTAAVITVVPTTRIPAPSPLAGTRSAVRRPSSFADRTAASTSSAAGASPSDQRRSIAVDRIVPSGLAASRPAMSGAEPWIGSYKPNRPCSVRRSPREAEGSMPRLPARTAAS